MTSGPIFRLIDAKLPTAAVSLQVLPHSHSASDRRSPAKVHAVMSGHTFLFIKLFPDDQCLCSSQAAGREEAG